MKIEKVLFFIPLNIFILLNNSEFILNFTNKLIQKLIN